MKRQFLVASFVVAVFWAPPLHSNPAPPTQSRQPDSDPMWSPGGRELGFRRVTAAMSVRPDGTGVRTLVSRGLVTWLPGGRMGLATIDGIYEVSRDGSRRRVTRGEQPAWSSDGRKVAVTRYESERNTDRLVIVDVRTGAERVVPGPACRCAYSDGQAFWSPDGRRVMFDRFVDDLPRKQTDGLMVVNADGTGMHEVIGRLVERPSWSSSGDAIVAQYWTKSSAVVAVADAGGGSTREIGPGSSPAWSPSGDRIAFRSRDGVLIARRDGSGVRKLPGPGGWTCVSKASPCNTPAWSRDGKSVVFQSGLEIVVARTDGSRSRVVGRGIHPTWSPDGRWIAFATAYCGSRQGVYVVRPNGQGLRRLTRHCWIFGSEIAERISGTRGDDTIHAKEGKRDEVSCLEGRDLVVADRKDVVATDCETVKRR